MTRTSSRRQASSLRVPRSFRLVSIVALTGLVLTTSACSELASSIGVAAGAGSSPGAAPATPGAAASAPTTSASGGYSITFGVRSSAGRLGAVQFDARAPGDWKGSGDKVVCSSVVAGAMHACNDKGGGKLSCGFITTQGMPTPSDLVRCDLDSKKPVAAADITIQVVDASNAATKPVTAQVVVTRVSAR